MTRFFRLALLLVLLAGDARRAAATPAPSDTLEVFVTWGCPHCDAAKRFLDRLRRERPDLVIQLVDVGADLAGRERLIQLSRQHHVSPVGVPTFHYRSQLIVGWDHGGSTEAAIRRLAGGAAPDSARRRVPAVPDSTARAPPDIVEVRWLGSLSATRLGLPLFSFAIGFIDGVNPCAMWALLYVLTLLVTLGDRRKMLILGGTFVAVGGVLYFVFIAAWLEMFLVLGISRPVQLILGTIAVLAGAVHVKDFAAPGRGVSLSIPEASKPRLYRQARRVVTAENLAGAILAVAVLSALVNLTELLCTAGLPAVFTQVLVAHQLGRLEFYGNLAIYVAAYVLDDTVVLGIAVVTLSRKRLQARAGRWLKLVSGLVLAGLGLVMLFRPEWLR